MLTRPTMGLPCEPCSDGGGPMNLRKKLLPPGRYWCAALGLFYVAMIVAMVGFRLAFWAGLACGLYVLGALYFQWWTERHTIRAYHQEVKRRQTLATDADRRWS